MAAAAAATRTTTARTRAAAAAAWLVLLLGGLAVEGGGGKEDSKCDDVGETGADADEAWTSLPISEIFSGTPCMYQYVQTASWDKGPKFLARPCNQCASENIFILILFSQ